MGWKILFLIFLSQVISSERILVVSFFGSRSHKNAFDPLYIELAKKGHQLTVIHPVKSGYNDKNIKEINGMNLDNLQKEKKPPSKEEEGHTPPPNMFDMRLKGQKIRAPISPSVTPFLRMSCASYYEMPEVKTVLKQKFALVFMGSHMNECAYGLLHKLNTSYIFVHPHPMEHYKIVFSGLRLPPSFVPAYAAGAISNDMDIFERTWNFFTYQWTTALYEWYYLPKMESTYREALGEDVPSVREIERNASLVFNNAHFSLSYPRPQLPQVVDVGGMHCRQGQPLPQDILEFVESSGSDGFIYFSMGSIVKIKDMPPQMLQDFIKVFSKIKQKVIWKSEEDKIEGLSKNVKLVKWAPQQDLLAHPKIRIFLTHGGLLSMEEAIYHGVPLIGLPLFGDQHDWNMKQAETHGFGIPVELKGLTAEQILGAINKVLADKSFASAANLLGKLFKDRESDALETAVFWTEYVIRNKGAVHLRSPASRLNFISYYSIDVISLLFTFALLLIYIPIKLFKIIFCRSSLAKTTPSKKDTKSPSKKNN